MPGAASLPVRQREFSRMFAALRTISGYPYQLYIGEDGQLEVSVREPPVIIESAASW